VRIFQHSETGYKVIIQQPLKRKSISISISITASDETISAFSQAVGVEKKGCCIRLCEGCPTQQFIFPKGKTKEEIVGLPKKIADKLIELRILDLCEKTEFILFFGPKLKPFHSLVSSAAPPRRFGVTR
jgi:hypothetical protein